MLAAGALVASLLAVGASPAGALDANSKPNAPATTSACVGDATDDMMFSDVSESHAFRAAINCLAYYGVTIGYGDGTFRPNADVSREEMVLFMERAAAVAGADADKVVGDFATTGSDPVNRGHMALLIARLLVAATTAESPVNVENNKDGTFTIKKPAVAAKDWDFFADARNTLNRVEDSAVSALYETGVAKGTGMGNFSPASTVSRGAMAAFITRALAHTTARPEGVTIQSDAPGEVIISVRDANFHPKANAAVDVFSAPANKAAGAFKADGTCITARLTGQGGNTKVCEINALDAVTGLDGDFDPGAITGHAANLATGGTVVWAWTGAMGDKVTDAAGLPRIHLTKAAPVTAANAKVTTDIAEGVTRVHFGETVTVTIQLVGSETAKRANAGPTGTNNSYTVTIRRANDLNQQTDGSPTAVTGGTGVVTQTVKVDASGKATFTITAADPDPTDSNNPDGDSDATPAVPNRIDRTRVTFTVVPATANGGPTVESSISSTGDGGSQTITFSDAKAKLGGGSLKTAVDFLTRPATGSASNVAIVTVVDQYGKPIRGHLVRLGGDASSLEPSENRTASYPVARRTDSSGTVRIGYSYTGAATTETIAANTSVTNSEGNETLTAITGATKKFYWVEPAPKSTTDSPEAANGTVVVAALDDNTLVVSPANGAARLVVYDDNDQFNIGGAPASMAAFEAALTTDGKRQAGRNDTIVVTSYDPTDSGAVARLALTVVADSG